MDTVIFLLLVPIVIFIAVQLYNHHQGVRFDSNKHLIPFIIAVVIILIGYGVGMWSEVVDTEIRNGAVTSKERDTVSCSHSYQCRCKPVTSCSGSGSSRSCSTSQSCDTCYEHSFDYNWVVHTNIPYDFEIDRVDRQGSDEPPRWSSVKVGDPVSDKFSYTNYVKGAKHSLYNKNMHSISLIDKVPEYPSTIHDYYHVNRVIGVGVPVTPEWNNKLQTTLSTLGPKYQVNAIVVLTTYGDDFDAALEAKWNGAKKNDVVMIFHLDNATDKNLKTVYVSSWTDKNIFKVELRDSLFGLGAFDMDKVLSTFTEQITKNWKRKEMKDFSYLTAEIELETWVILLILVLSLGGYAGMYRYMVYKSGYSPRRRFS